MGWSLYQCLIATLMVVTGSINTLSVKWANKITAVNSVGVRTEFNHPFLQASAMFLGEMLCMVAYFIIRAFNRLYGSKPNSTDKLKFTWKKGWIFFIPAMCDMTATSIMYIGLTLTSASSFQMLRGAVIIFTGIASMVFLKKRLMWFQWLGMFVICGGLVLVAIADIINSDSFMRCSENGTQLAPVKEEVAYIIPFCDAEDYTENMNSNELLGDFFIIGAQIIVSLQMVYEEKFLSKYHVEALHAVGWEGIFGFFMLTLLLIPMGLIGTNSSQWGHSPVPPYVIENSLDGLVQLGNEGLLLFAFCGTIFSIAFFNFAGISVTQELSATTRMVLDSVRTLIIWAISLTLRWQSFHFLQIIGFIVLMVGMSLYNDILILPLIRRCLCRIKNEGVKPLVDSEASTTE